MVKVVEEFFGELYNLDVCSRTEESTEITERSAVTEQEIKKSIEKYKRRRTHRGNEVSIDLENAGDYEEENL